MTNFAQIRLCKLLSRKLCDGGKLSLEINAQVFPWQLSSFGRRHTCCHSNVKIFGGRIVKIFREGLVTLVATNNRQP